MVVAVIESAPALLPTFLAAGFSRVGFKALYFSRPANGYVREFRTSTDSPSAHVSSRYSGHLDVPGGCMLQKRFQSLLLTLAVFAVSPVWAQDTGVISGTVTD